MLLMQFQKKIWNKFFISLIICSLVLSLFGCSREDYTLDDDTADVVYENLQKNLITSRINDYFFLPEDIADFFRIMEWDFDEVTVDPQYTLCWPEEDWFRESVFSKSTLEHYHWTPAVALNSKIPAIIIWDEHTETRQNFGKNSTATKSQLINELGLGESLRVAGRAFNSKLLVRYKGFKYDNIGNLSRHSDFSKTVGQQIKCIVIEADIIDNYKANIVFNTPKPFINYEYFPMIGTPVEEE